MPMQIKGTVTPNSPPTGLVERQLSVEMGSSPPKLWCGVPASIDPVNGRVQISPPIDYVTQAQLTAALPTLPLAVASGGTGVANLTGQVPAGTVNLLYAETAAGLVRSSPQIQTYDGGFYVSRANPGAAGSYCTLWHGRGTLAVPAALQSGDDLGILSFAGHPPRANGVGASASIQGSATQAWTTAARGSSLQFTTTANGTEAERPVLALGQDGVANPLFARGGTGPITTFGVTPQRGLRPFVVGGPEGGLGIANSDAEIGYWEKAGLCVASWGTTQGVDVPYVSFYRGRNTRAAPQAVQSGDALGFIQGQGHPAASTGSSMAFRARENFTATAQGSCIEFVTTRSGTVSNYIRLIVEQAGDLVMPANPPQNATLPWMISPWDDSMWIAHQINWTGLRIGQPNGDLRITGTVAEKPGGGAWTPTSDSRLKRDVEAYTRGLDIIRQLSPVSFCYNGRGETIDDGTRFIGLEAEAAREVMPEIVGTMRVKLDPERRRAADGHVERDMPDTDVLTVDPNALWYALINATKELDARVSKLETR